MPESKMWGNRAASVREPPALTGCGERHTVGIPMAATRKKVVVAMSGGVDSSVAAALLLREGFDVVGAFLRLGSPKGVEPQDPSGGPASAGPSCDTTGKSKQGCCSVLDA